MNTKKRVRSLFIFLTIPRRANDMRFPWKLFLFFQKSRFNILTIYSRLNYNKGRRINISQLELLFFSAEISSVNLSRKKEILKEKGNVNNEMADFESCPYWISSFILKLYTLSGSLWEKWMRKEDESRIRYLAWITYLTGSQRKMKEN